MRTREAAEHARDVGSLSGNNGGMKSHQSKLAIIGAGSVGTSVAYASLIRGIARNVAIYDVNKTKVEAEVLDLAHGSQFFAPSAVTGGSNIRVVDDANVVVVTAGARQKPGQTRLDLAEANTAILRDLMPKLVERAPNAVFVLVTNPCDVLTVAAQQIVDLPPGRIFSSGTVLDTSRLRWKMAQLAGVSSASVHATMVGEHGDSEFALWSSATIGGVPISEWADAEGRNLFTPNACEYLEHEVAHAAYKVIEGKGATNYAIGLAGARIVDAILSDSHSMLPVSAMLTDYRGVSGVAMSVPCVVGRDGVQRQLDFPMNDSELAKFNASAETLHASCKKLGL